jgi:hypothetical protein
VDKERALHIAMTAIMREIMRDEGDNRANTPPPSEPTQGPPQPRFDFTDDDLCEHNGMLMERAKCPVHSDEAQQPVTAEELDDMTRETFEEENPMIARARRLAEQRQRQEAQQRLYPEDLENMKGMGPPPPEEPPLVV